MENLKSINSKNINVIITAGGLSQRYGVENKLFEPCGASCVLVEAIKPFLSFEEITSVIVAIEPSFSDELLNWLSVLHLDEDTRIKLTLGGTSRTKTVQNGLKAIADDCDIVLVHDGARPYVTESIIEQVIDGAKKCGAALPLLRLTDALVSVKNGVLPKDRDDYRAVQTPAGFSKNRILTAYSMCETDFFDDISVVQTYCKGEVEIVEGDKNNIKITTKSDLITPLVGCGYDIHRLVQGDGIKLNGVFVPCPFSFVAHSDGDVPIHAIMDAILSALGERDIGHFFPVDDPKYDNADSLALLATVLGIMRQKNFKIANVTVTIIAEKPHIAPLIDKMRSCLSPILDVSPSRIGIAATSNEQVGTIGDGNAIAAYASVLLIR